MNDILLSLKTVDDQARVLWERDIKEHLSKSVGIYQYFWRKISLNIGIREARYKMIHSWYITSSQLAVMFPAGVYNCWKCAHPKDYFYHVWWDCKKILMFWKLAHKKCW